MPEPTLISSRDNPLFKELRKLGADNAAYRKTGRYWIEGDHLCRAALQRGLVPAIAVLATSVVASPPVDFRPSARKIVVLADALFAELSSLESPAKLGCVLELPPPVPVQAGVATVVLDRLQDAGNVGSILRSASAFGFRQVIALKGSVALWSRKVLRAGMGAHFGLTLIEGIEVADLHALQVPLVVTSSHQGDRLGQRPLPSPCAWVLGHEGQGVCRELMDQAQVFVSIGQPGGEESLNVAAAAAICLHASSQDWSELAQGSKVASL